MSKTVSTRIDNNTHKDLVERCNQLGCNINEFVGEAVKFMLTNETEFDFEPEDKEDSEDEPIEVKKEPKSVPMQSIRIIES